MVVLVRCSSRILMARAPFEKAVRAPGRAALPGACYGQGICSRTIPSTSVTRQTAQGCARCVRLHEGICQVATKHAHKGWARWGKTVQPVPLTSSYSSLQGTNRYSRESVIQGPHGGVTFAGFLLTELSQFHPISTRMSYPIEGGTHMREKLLFLGQYHCWEVSTMHGGKSSGARRQ
jgi:hypothetical protein